MALSGLCGNHLGLVLSLPDKGMRMKRKLLGELWYPTHGRQVPLLILAIVIALLMLLGTCDGSPVKRAYAKGPLEWDWQREGMVALIVDLAGPAIWVPKEFARDANAVKVLACESSYQAKAIGDHGRAYGLFQIRVDAHKDLIRDLGYTPADMLKPRPNLTVAVALWRERGWQPWVACGP